MSYYIVHAEDQSLEESITVRDRAVCQTKTGHPTKLARRLVTGKEN